MKNMLMCAVCASALCATTMWFSNQDFEDDTLSTVEDLQIPAEFDENKELLQIAMYDPELRKRVVPSKASSIQYAVEENRIIIKGLKTYENVYVYSNEGELIKIANSDINGKVAVRLDNFPDKEFIIKTTSSSYQCNKKA